MTNNDKQYLVQKIRAQYTERQITELDSLRVLDSKVKRPANIFAYVFGGISAVIMGSGMSLVMTEIGETLGMANTMVPGIVIGVVGLAMALLTYPAYSKILASRRKKYAKEILELSEKIMSEE